MTKGAHIVPDKDPAEMARFVVRGRQIQELLQSVEDALIGAGYDDFVVATKHGRFREPGPKAEELG